LSADTIVPGAGNPQAWNRYTFVFNNPLGYVDASGHIPYPITIRSFAPFDYFGFGYNGDNRGYSTSANVTSKAEQKINLIPTPPAYPRQQVIQERLIMFLIRMTNAKVKLHGQ
jgi:hypothetical protein